MENSLVHVLRCHADARPEHVAFTFLEPAEVDVTYGALDLAARTIAAALQGSGVVRGDRVLIAASTGLNFVHAFFGALYAGAVAMPVAPPRSPTGISAVTAHVRQARPRFAFLGEETGWPRAESDELELGGLRVLRVDPKTGRPEDWRPSSIEADMPALLQFTSGSTTVPRGVQVSHGNLLHNVRMMAGAFGTSQMSVLVTWLPLFHDMGLIGNLLHAACLGARCVLITPISFLRRPALWLETIGRYRADFSGAPNFAYDYCVEKIDEGARSRLDLRAWRVAFNGAEPIRHETLASFARHFADAGFSPHALFPCYGLAEGTLYVAGRPWDSRSGVMAVATADLEQHRVRAPRDGEPAKKLVTCGTAADGLQVEIVDPQRGSPLPEGQIGEVWIAGPSVACGYFEAPTATAETFGARLPDGSGPFLRTGDLGFMHAGQLFITGRLKDVIIVGGRNHYPQDIEFTVRTCDPRLRSANNACFGFELDGRERVAIVQELRSPAADFAALCEAIRHAVFDAHEVQPARIVFVRRGGVPKTSSGKVMRNSCRARLLTGELPVLYDSWHDAAASEASIAEPPSPLVRARELVADTLHLILSALDDDRPLVALGLDSLSAAELRMRVQRETGKDDVPRFEDLLSTGTIRWLAAAMTDRPGQDPVPAAMPHDGPVLTSMQRELWLIEQLTPGSHNIPFAVAIQGKLDQERLRRACDSLLERHEALRIAFDRVNDELIARVADQVSLDLSVTDLVSVGRSGPQRDTCARQLRDLARADAALPFDLSLAPLVRARLTRLAPDYHVLVIVAHHLVADAWSVAVLIRDLAALYAGREATLPPPRSLSPHVVPTPMSRGDQARTQQSLSFWSDRLGGAEWSIALPRRRSVRQRAGLAVRGSRASSPEMRQAMEALARRERVTAFAVALSAFGLLLHRYSGQSDLAIGTVVAIRGHRDAREVVGPLINTVVLRIDLSGDPTFRDLVQRVHSVVSAALDHADLPLRDALRGSGHVTHGRAPFDVMVVQEPPAPPPIDCCGLRWAALDLDLPLVPFDLTLTLRPSPGGLSLAIDADAGMFDRAAVETVLGHYEHLLWQALAAPRRRCSRLSPWRAEELRGPRTPAVETPFQPVHVSFMQAAGRSPDAAAITVGDGTWSYGRLQSVANAIARLIQARGAGPETLVGVDVSAPALRLAAVLGVLQAGAAYLALDPGLPASRRDMITRDAGPGLILTDFPGECYEPEQTVLVDATMQQAEAVCVPVRADQLAYVLYTSGSTGKPLGVAISHGSLSRHCESIVSAYELGSADRVLQFASFGFDVWAEEVFPTLRAGGTVLTVTDHLPSAVQRTVLRHGGTVLNLPSRYCELFAAEMSDALPSVRLIVIGSEAISANAVRAIRARFPSASCIHAYGLTEATITTTLSRVGQDSLGDRNPIGAALPGTATHVLDGGLRPVGPGARGELFVGGVGVGRGYWADPATTADRFVPDPFGIAGERMLRTGDVVCRHLDGELEFVGRADTQLKINGYRAEPAEIEAAIRSSGAREAVVVAIADQLIAYVEPGAHSLEETRAATAAQLPSGLVPSRWVKVDGWLRTVGGKIDRHRLPECDTDVANGDPPRGDVEAALAEIFGEILGLQNVSRDTDFFLGGGDSLSAMRLLSRIERKFGVVPPIVTIFEASVLSDLATFIERAVAAPGAPTTNESARRPTMETLPLTAAQHRLWFLESLQPGTARYNMPLALVITGPLDEDRFAAAFDALIDRHEALRTRIDGNGASPGPRPRIETQAVGSRADAERRANDLARQPFDLTRGPLLRAVALRVTPEERLIVIVVHHIICDGRSLQIMFQELGEFYRSARQPTPAELRYAHHVIHEGRRDHGEGIQYWAQQVAGSEPVWLPYDGQENNGVAGRIQARLPITTSELRTLARRGDVTMHMALVGALQVFLHRCGGATDIRVAVPVANRRNEAINAVVGCFVNTVVLRTPVRSSESFLEHLQRVKRTALEAYDHQDTPFDDVVAAVQPGRGPGAPLIEVMLLVEGDDLSVDLGEGIDVSIVELENAAAKFDITLTLRLRGRIVEADFEYDEGRFQRETIVNLLGSFQELMKSIVREPEQAIGTFSILSEAAEQRIMTWASGGPADAVRLVHRRIAEQAARMPDAVAVESARPLTYRELEERSNQVAHGLARRGIGSEALVALRMSRTEDLVVAMLGVLKAGAAYLPIDPEYPAERQRYMETDSGAAIMLKGISEFRHEKTAPFAADVLPSQLAYVLYTSGSQGHPKGVAISHASVSAFLDWIATTYAPDELRRVFAGTSVCFDLSVFEIYGTLSLGGTVVLADNIMELGEVRDVTLVNTVPSAMIRLVDKLPASVTTVNLAGEVLPASLVNALYEREVGAVWNLYGPTEDTTYSTAARISPGTVHTPAIGRALPGATAYVLDDHMALVPPSARGELYLGGAGLARGYLSDPARTAERFVPNPYGGPGERLYRTGDIARYRSDGSLEYLGRRDRQVKVRGYRIEPAEVEDALRSAGALEAVVVSKGDRLTAYVEVKTGSLGDVRRAASEMLPRYLLPTEWTQVQSWSRTPSGKIDRARLAELDRRGTRGNAPRGTVEQAIATIYEEVLEVSNVTRETNFFEVGGHSLLAMQAVGRIESAFSVELCVREIFEAQTVAELASRVEAAGPRRLESGPPPSAVRAPSLPIAPVTAAQRRLWFMDQLVPGGSQYNIPMVLTVEGSLDIQAFTAAIRGVVEHHESLRTTFPAVDGVPVQRIAPPADAIPLTVVDLDDGDVERFVSQEVERPFRLDEGPLFRITVIRPRHGKVLLVLVMHHIIFDEWSVGVLSRELSERYRAARGGVIPSLPTATQMAEVAAWEAMPAFKERWDEHRQFWQERLEGLSATRLPGAGKPRHMGAQPGSHRVFLIDRATAEEVRRLASRERATPSMVLLAAFDTVLFHHTGDEDLAIGVPVANRRRETESSIGFFVNELVVRVDMGGQPTFVELVRRVRAAALDAYAHQDLPFDEIVAVARTSRTHPMMPLVNIQFDSHTSPFGDVTMDDLTLVPRHVSRITVQFDLQLSLEEMADGWQCVLGTNTERIDDAWAQNFADEYVRFIADAVTAPQRRIDELQVARPSVPPAPRPDEEEDFFFDGHH